MPFALPFALPHWAPQALRTSALLLALACPWMPASHAQAPLALPSMGDGADITTSEERRIGDRIIRSLYRDPDYLDDPQLHAYVMGIWQPLVAAAQARGDMSDELQTRFAWQILLGRDKSINAFALPGGYLGVHLGLIAAVSSSDELATVLAHELTHVTQRHIARRLGQEKKNMPLVIAGMVLGALAASKSPDAANALIVGGQAAAVQNQLGFSRDMEREADRIGHSLLAPAGFAPQGAVSMFEKLQHASRLNDNGSWPYLRSHPLTTERMADMQARVPAGHSQPPTPTWEHALMAGRARVLARPGVDALRQWAQLPQQATWAQLPLREQASQLYVAALSQLQLKDLPAAQRTWQQLQAHTQQHGDSAAQQQVRWLGAELALAAQQPQTALAAVPAWPAVPSAAVGASTASPPPSSAAAQAVPAHHARPATLLRSQALLAAGQPQPVADQLGVWVTQHPQDAAAWQLLAQAWQALNQPLRALRAQAEAHVAHYDYPAALDRFQAAQDAARRSQGAADYIEGSIIDTRLRAVQSLLREQAREQ